MTPPSSFRPCSLAYEKNERLGVDSTNSAENDCARPPRSPMRRSVATKRAGDSLLIDKRAADAARSLGLDDALGLEGLRRALEELEHARILEERIEENTRGIALHRGGIEGSRPVIRRASRRRSSLRQSRRSRGSGSSGSAELFDAAPPRRTRARAA